MVLARFPNVIDTLLCFLPVQTAIVCCMLVRCDTQGTSKYFLGAVSGRRMSDAMFAFFLSVHKKVCTLEYCEHERWTNYEIPKEVLYQNMLVSLASASCFDGQNIEKRLSFNGHNVAKRFSLDGPTPLSHTTRTSAGVEDVKGYMASSVLTQWHLDILEGRVRDVEKFSSNVFANASYILGCRMAFFSLTAASRADIALALLSKARVPGTSMSLVTEARSLYHFLHVERALCTLLVPHLVSEQWIHRVDLQLKFVAESSYWNQHALLQRYFWAYAPRATPRDVVHVLRDMDVAVTLSVPEAVPLSVVVSVYDRLVRADADRLLLDRLPDIDSHYRLARALIGFPGETWDRRLFSVLRHGLRGVSNEFPFIEDQHVVARNGLVSIAARCLSFGDIQRLTAYLSRRVLDELNVALISTGVRKTWKFGP